MWHDGWPSWVPRWDRLPMRHPGQLRIFFEAGGPRSMAASSEDPEANVLSLRGFVVIVLLGSLTRCKRALRLTLSACLSGRVALEIWLKKAILRIILLRSLHIHLQQVPPSSAHPPTTSMWRSLVLSSHSWRAWSVVLETTRYRTFCKPEQRTTTLHRLDYAIAEAFFAPIEVGSA